LLGIVIVVLKEPVFEETTVFRGLLSKFIVIDVLIAKLLPDTVTTVPGAPDVGESVTPDVVAPTVNVADADNAGLLLSVAVII
jgi:hypothetical protein